MSETPKPNQERALKLTTRGRVVAAGGLLALGAATGVSINNAVQSELDQREYTRSQPACEINVQQDDSISKIEVRLEKAGNKADPADIRVYDDKDGHRLYNSDGPSLGMQPGDIAVFDHVTPAACVAMEGLVPVDQPGGPVLVNAGTAR